ncbi:unnamed protein product [Arabidopsis halleri]
MLDAKELITPEEKDVILSNLDRIHGSIVEISHVANKASHKTGRK